MLLLINSTAHFLVDALCASALFMNGTGAEDFALSLIVYNTLAFSSQCLVGLFLDARKKHALYSSAGMLVIVLGFLLPLPAVIRAAIIGAGNSVFHAASGIITLKTSENRAAPLGVFVAPGAVGLALGTLWPELGKYFTFLLTAAAVALPLVEARGSVKPSDKETPGFPPAENGRIGALLLLILAVAVRAIGGTAADFPWKTTPILTVVLSVCVLWGKGAGGFLLDAVGAKRASVISVPTAAVLIAFFSAYMLPSLVGQFALNLTMPVTLYLMYRLIPDRPGLAFGLAASALWPGTLVGSVMPLAGNALSILILISFVFGLIAILYSERVLNKEIRRKI